MSSRSASTRTGAASKPRSTKAAKPKPKTTSGSRTRPGAAAGGKPKTKGKTGKKKAKKAKSDDASAIEAKVALNEVAAAEAALEGSLPEEDPWGKYEGPWGGPLTPGEQWARLQGGELGTALSLRPVRDAGSTLDLSGAALDALWEDAVLRGAGDSEEKGGEEKTGEGEEGKGEPGGACPECLVMRSCDLRTVVLSRRLRGQLISLDLTDNRLGSEAIDSIAPNYLRRLVLAGNIARDIPSLASFQQLVDLDLSFNPIEVVRQGAFGQLARRLRRLNLAGCQITSLMEGRTFVLEDMKAQLEQLVLSSNKLGSVRELLEVGKLKRLTHLFVDGNEWEHDAGFEDSVTTMKRRLSCLQELNGRPATAKFAKGPLSSALVDSMERSTAVGGGGDDSASCSCIEGNPCAVPYNCKHWESRFEVARKAREESLHPDAM